LNYKVKGLPLVKVLHLKDGRAQVLSFPDESYTAKGFSTNFIENDVRVSYSSLARPNTIYIYDFDKNKLNILKEQQIPSGHIPSDYEVKRVWADNDGVNVPISLVYKKSLFKHDGTNPLYLYGYGSYGIATEPAFRPNILSLVDRGFVYAIAHVRGGNELGYQWYLDGKFLKKKNTFDDFLVCAETLIAEKYTSEGNIVAMGGSAGGILVGAAVNMKPELFKAIVAHVPFVDVLNTMLDASLPLTPLEYNEWGNPNDKEYFDYIRSYSPYDNVEAKEYPYIFVTTGASDPRVGYWEAAKWVAKLREMKKNENQIVLKIDLDSGHSGASSRFDYIKEVAEEFAFIIKVFEVEI
jgi:oligopeptidase B